MENLHQIELISNENWFIKKMKEYQVTTITIGLLTFNHYTIILSLYFENKEVFFEEFSLNIWAWLIIIPIFSFLMWLFVIWIISKFPEEKLKQKFLRHPIATILLFLLFVLDLPSRIQEYSVSINGIFETVITYAFYIFLWWLLICWISSKIFRKQNLTWSWYEKVINSVFSIFPYVYKLILGLTIAVVLFSLLFHLIKYLFNYTGKDLKTLFP